jgi:DNA-binding transcriptional LysR family regulator
VDTRRVALLLALSRLGSMRKVAETFALTTSTVSQQIAALASETGEQLIEPDGRRVRLKPAGRRLADHAVTILAAVDAARLDLDPDAEPVGTVRVGGFATGIRVSLLPIVRELAATHPRVEAAISEYEPLEAFELLVDDDLDLAITYDYDLAPAPIRASNRFGCGRLRGVWAFRPIVRRTVPPISVRSPTRFGLSTRAIQLTRMRYALWRRWLVSRRISPIKSTAWTLSKI